MLAGLIFATEDAEGRSDLLAATLPFGGMTLIEYQSRLLIAAGVGHLIVAVGRVTPALLGAVARIARRGIAVDVVRSAQEASEKLHPLARVLVFSDSLVTTDRVALAMASETPDALLVTEDDKGPAAVERVDSDAHWAGVALISANRIAEIAAMPRDYDFQSTLLRVAVQTGSGQVMLPMSARRAGHGIERDSAAMAKRSKEVMIALANQRVGWADRYVFTPITRIILPWLVTKSVPDWVMPVVGLVLALAALALIGLDFIAVGGAIAPLAVASWSTGTLLSGLRGNDRNARIQGLAIPALTIVTALFLGVRGSLDHMDPLPIVLAFTLVGLATIAERLPVRQPPWASGAPLYILILAIASIAGQLAIGLGVGAIIAMVTLAALVETTRKKA